MGKRDLSTHNQCKECTVLKKSIIAKVLLYLKTRKEYALFKETKGDNSNVRYIKMVLFTSSRGVSACATCNGWLSLLNKNESSKLFGTESNTNKKAEKQNQGILFIINTATCIWLRLWVS